jgi:hypothetical protein
MDATAIYYYRLAGLNTYSYVGNDPVAYRDPSGNDRVPDPFAGDPNSVTVRPQGPAPDGVQIRYRGPDGNPFQDIDYGNNPGHGADPEIHYWTPPGDPMGRQPFTPVDPQRVPPPPTRPDASYQPWPRQYPASPWTPPELPVLGPLIIIMTNPCVIKPHLFCRPPSVSM